MPDGFEAAGLVLKPAQERVLASLGDRGVAEFTRADYEGIAHVSRSQAAYDLADLVKAGIVQRLGSGRTTRYRIERASGGRKRKWTPERIRAELAKFSSKLGRWPRAAEFKEAGHADLYLAASRYGGIDYWIAELGFSEPRSARPAIARRWARRTGTGAIALAAVAATALLTLWIGESLPEDPAPQSQAPLSQLGPRSEPSEQATIAENASLASERAGGQPQPIVLRLAAATGGSWIEIRRVSAWGEVIYSGVLERGQSVRFRGKRFWLRLAAPAALTARINGKLAALPERASSVLVTRKGIRVLETVAPVVSPILISSQSTDESESPRVSTTASSSVSPSPSRPTPDPAPAPDPSPDPVPDGP
jgi:uncharacterized protein DUF4115